MTNFKDLGKRMSREHPRDQCYGFTVAKEQRLSFIRRWITSGILILDVGCRDGILMDSLGAGYRPIGMDVDFEALRKCRTSGRRVFRGDLNNGLAVQSEVFDAVFAGEVLEHTYFPIEGLKEIHRVLKPGGLFLGSVPNSFRLKNRLKFLIGHEFEPNPLHFHFFSPEKLTALLVEAGFENPNVEFLDSRYLAIWPKLFGNIMVWASRRPIR